MVWSLARILGMIIMYRPRCWSFEDLSKTNSLVVNPKVRRRNGGGRNRS